MQQIKDIGEVGLIERIHRKSKNNLVLMGIGDDAAVVKTKDGLQVLTTDCMVKGDHFRTDWFTPKQIGMKAIEVNVSDVAAMGGIPKYALISLALPKTLDISFIDEFYDGMWNDCEKYSMEIIGGNMTHSEKIVISITLVGEVDKKNLCLRSDAKPGDYIFVSGEIGFGRAGLRVFQEELPGFQDVKKRYLEPKARLDISKEISSYVNAMIDISDGLSSEIKHICDESKCGAVIYEDKIPINESVCKVAKKLKENEKDYALYGGEDFELLYTVSKKDLDDVNGIMIGRIIDNKSIMIESNGKEKELIGKGYDHFI